MAKKSPPYILRNPKQLNVRFYEGFDHKFLFRKAQTLMYLFDQRDQFKDMVARVDEQSENTSNEYLTGKDIDDKYFEGLKAEVYFTEMHQFECFFALLLAMFQKLPHWLYLTTYQPGEIKHAVQKFLEGHIKAITNDLVDTKMDFIVHAVYAEFPLSDTSREATLDNLVWFLERLGEKYLEAVDEYNSYKHGLRVLTGPSQFSLRLNDANGVPHGPAYVLGASEDAFSFLELEDKGEGGSTVVEVNRHFNPEENFLHLYMMQVLLGEMKKTRLARLRGETEIEIMTLTTIDKDNIQSLRKFFTWRLTV